ncbi:MAG: type IX secretion system membrane protein PorP/SprF [Elusimicrobia bacterium]|nr:type IX secretion system membrane protein PorP/SprF [Elusimicrobiota bacterium]
MAAALAAMGNASLASPFQSSSLFINPATLAGMRSGDVYLMYNQLYPGIDVGHIGQGLISTGWPTRYGSFGFGVGTFAASGLKNERTISLAYAYPVHERVKLGLTGKQLYHGYSVGSDPLASADPVFRDGTSQSTLSLDAGMVLSLSDPFEMALAVRNLNAPDVGLTSRDRVPREAQLGLAYSWSGVRFKATADLAYRAAEYGTFKDKFVPSVGVEKSFENDLFQLRAGASPWEFTAGFGLKFGRYSFDYAMVLRRNLVAGYGNHLVGLRVEFGPGEEKSRRLTGLPPRQDKS